MTAPSTSLDIRRGLVEALRLDLVGPDNTHAFAHELLPEPPSRWYLAGFLVPEGAAVEDRSDETSSEELDATSDAGGLDDAAQPERAAATRRRLLPSSMGMSVLLPGTPQSLEVAVAWGEYAWEGGETEPSDQAHDDGVIEGGITGRTRGYRRSPRGETVTIDLPDAGSGAKNIPLPGAGGIKLVVTSRRVEASRRLPEGALAVSVFLVNARPPAERPYQAILFQAELTLSSEPAFVPRPDLRGSIGGTVADEWDERVGDLHYRDVFEFAVGHGVSTTALRRADGTCHEVRTVWIPSAEIERIAPTNLEAVELRMEQLGSIGDHGEALARLSPMVAQYQAWIQAQTSKIDELEQGRAATARDLLTNARLAARRIEHGISLLADPQVFEAFRIANRSMAAAARRREAIRLGTDPASVQEPMWRPFQLAFILMTLGGIADPLHDDRETVDLLFFPTGGGKTEAYLGLAAITIVLRRLRTPGIRSAGVCVLMRYTLRLLTLDQLSRAAGLVCALELERVRDPARLGEWPFEIGLWVGSAATPNRRSADSSVVRWCRCSRLQARIARTLFSPARNQRQRPRRGSTWAWRLKVGA